MKYLLIFLLSVAAAASEFTLAFDASPSANVTNYLIYGSTNTNQLTTATLTNAPIQLSVGLIQTNKVHGMTAGPWYFIAIAQAGGISSDPSATLLINVPLSGSNLRIVTGP